MTEVTSDRYLRGVTIRDLFISTLFKLEVVDSYTLLNALFKKH
jgi:hypothetical protein